MGSAEKPALHTEATAISCYNSQGDEVHASVLRLTRFFAVFEVYNPYSIIQLSEVLSNFKIFVRQKVIYAGRATVTNIVNAGIVMVVEVTLQDDWKDIDILQLNIKPRQLLEEFEEFVSEWEKVKNVKNEFKVAIADSQSFLTGLNRWLEQIELGVNAEPSFGFREGAQELYENLANILAPRLEPFFLEFEEIVNHVPDDEIYVHRVYAKQQMHPLLLCSPFVYRTYSKPLGYAGDYEMVNMMLRSPFEGNSLYAKFVNYAFLQCAPAQAHRNRIRYLISQLEKETLRKMKSGQKGIRIFNLGCGPAKELQEFIAGSDLADKIDATLLDFNEETIRNTQEILEVIRVNHRRQPKLAFIKRSVNELLRLASRENEEFDYGTYDFVYCAGLFDYLSDRVCSRLIEFFFKLLAPDGMLLVTNVEESNPNRGWMEFILDWHLIYRSEQALRDTIPKTVDPVSIETSTDPTGVNVFLMARKSPEQPDEGNGSADGF